jgi:hypothetical protein
MHDQVMRGGPECPERVSEGALNLATKRKTQEVREIDVSFVGMKLSLLLYPQQPLALDIKMKQYQGSFLNTADH